METARKVFNNTLYLAFANIINLGIGIIWMALLARYVGPEGIGKYSYAQSVLAIVMLLVEFGFQNLVIRNVARDRDLAGKYFIAVISTKILLGFLVYGGFAVYTCLNGAWDTELKKIMGVVTATTLLQAFIAASTAIFYAYEKMKYEAWGGIIRTILSLGSGIAAINLKLTLVQILLVIFATSWIKLIWNYYFLFRFLDFKWLIKEKWFDWTFNFQMLKQSIPFAILVIIGVIYTNIVIIILQMFVVDKELGYFAAAQRIYSVLFIIPSMLLDSIFPTLSSSFKVSSKKMGEIYIKAYKYLWIFSVPMTLGVISTTKYYILLIYGDKFLPSVLPLQILALSLLNSVGYLNSPALLAMEKENFITISFGIVLILVAISSYIIIPISGVQGACWAVVIGNGVGFILYSFSLFRWLNLKYPFLVMGKVILASAGMALIVYLLLPYLHFMIVSLVIAPAIYVSLLVLLKVFDAEDKQMIWSLVPKFS